MNHKFTPVLFFDVGISLDKAGLLEVVETLINTSEGLITERVNVDAESILSEALELLPAIPPALSVNFGAGLELVVCVVLDAKCVSSGKCTSECDKSHECLINY